SMDFGYAFRAAAALSFIGMGAQPPQAEWGLMVADARGIFFAFWWTAVFPGLAIFITVLAVNLFGDGLNDYLNPHEGGH
ncbi:MAG: ABC transporter permease subunit, partial [Verrucomicrobiota bacterium]